MGSEVLASQFSMANILRLKLHHYGFGFDVVRVLTAHDFTEIRSFVFGPEFICHVWFTLFITLLTSRTAIITPRPDCPWLPARLCGRRRASWPAACPAFIGSGIGWRGQLHQPAGVGVHGGFAQLRRVHTLKRWILKGRPFPTPRGSPPETRSVSVQSGLIKQICRGQPKSALEWR